ncbi:MULTISPECIES: LysR family transcriptional regulator [unclassified Psychrobacter]|uniref:LysR family transcriptional regulator n=1 Tax=unclassified Psychrobacter TaxID=196806 RepID=UPI00078B5221|nr:MULTISPECIES: LysR family transcriptional regulator [unclassified Psychrobacter]AMN49319.1 LysR family transcriptional regulator [Psychrobacter sp. P2G3]AMN67158.1 LysR family transcriptional regulator [Psychrobacter sp. P11G5]
MELRHLRYFVAVAEEKSFNKAAQRLFISQPPLSRQIKQLEEEIGVTLIDRENRPLKLTEAGEFFYDHAIQILTKADNLRAMTMRKGNFDSSLSIGFVSSILYGILPKVIARFREIYPNINIKLYELNSWQQTQALTDGKIDVGFGRLLFEDASIRRLLLREESLVVAVPSGHRLAQERQASVRLMDLTNENLLLYPTAPRPSFIDYVLELFEARNLKANYFTEVRELHIALGLVAAGEGLTIVPKTLEHLRSQEVTYIPFEDGLLTSPIVMSVRHFDKSELLKTLLAVTYQIYDAEGFNYKREEI